MTALAYVDASALAKLILEETGSLEMRRWYVESERVVTSRVGVVETRRAVIRQAHDPAHLEVILRSVETVEFDAAMARAASAIEPATLKTLDAIHLASAAALAPELDAFVTYDDRLADAARALGLPVVRPAWAALKTRQVDVRSDLPA
ncbi:MAG: type II toxin-antitoxin system VapC family toxin [Chloroflexi bacterium]|nr:type II toxin-antitoxin system VapC family toxin [Chloroflexota bacterium]